MNNYTSEFKAKAVLEVLRGAKSLNEIASEKGLHPNLLGRWKAEAIKGPPTVFDEGKRKVAEKKVQEEKTQELYAQIGELTSKLNWLKKNLELNFERKSRLSMLSLDEEKFNITEQCELLGLNRTSLYYKPVPVSEKKLKILNRIDEIFTADPAFGGTTIGTILRREGLLISDPTVRKYMREMGLYTIYPGPNLSKRAHENLVYPYLLRCVEINRNNQVLGTDITYIRMRSSFLYLVAYMDWYSRYVISWRLSDSLKNDFVIEALEEALETAIPEIANSDQGSHFTSGAYTSLLLSKGVKISMDGRGRCMDNIFTERLWRSLKYQEVYLNEYTCPRDAHIGISNHFQKYNTYRPHQGLGGLTPHDVFVLGLTPISRKG